MPLHTYIIIALCAVLVNCFCVRACKIRKTVDNRQTILYTIIVSLYTTRQYNSKNRTIEDDIMKLLTSSLCKQGGREYNQDFLDMSVAKDGACLVVCDGLGSYFGSEVASRRKRKEPADPLVVHYRSMRGERLPLHRYNAHRRYARILFQKQQAVLSDQRPFHVADSRGTRADTAARYTLA